MEGRVACRRTVADREEKATKTSAARRKICLKLLLQGCQNSSQYLQVGTSFRGSELGAINVTEQTGRQAGFIVSQRPIFNFKVKVCSNRKICLTHQGSKAQSCLTYKSREK